MKFLFIPGSPLLVIALSLRDAESPAAVLAYIISAGVLIGGAVFVLLYATARFLRLIR